jgi:hypothetical protein
VTQQRLFLRLVTAACCLTVASGIAFGYWTNRWGPGNQLEAAGTHLQSFPTKIGEWRQIGETQIDEGTRTILECSGYVYRHYVSERTGAKVHVVVVVGPPGPISVHTPEICYSSRDFDLAEPRQKIVLHGKVGAPSFWQATFKSRAAGGGFLRSYYAWSSGDHWVASRSPRFEFGGSRILFKIQLACELQSLSTEQDTDACRSFLVALQESDWPLFEAKSLQLEHSPDGNR